MTRARIGIVSPTKSLLMIPSVLALIQAMAARGYQLDIYSWDDVGFPLNLPLRQNLRHFPLPQSSLKRSVAWRWQYLTQWIPYLLRQCRRERYVCLMGLDPWGLVLASIPARLCHTPTVYFSLDLLLRETIVSPYHRILKGAERFFNQLTEFTIIQDEARAKLLIRDNRIPPAQVVYLPNAPLGEANSWKTTILRDQLGLETGRKVILQAGSVDRWTQSLELARAARSWPNHLAMVFHVPLPLQTRYHQEFLTQIDGRQTYLSQRSLDLNQLIHLIRSADIGVALYAASENDPNMFTMGLASGKIAHYLQGGLPLVASGLPTIRKFVDQFRCGLCVDGAAQVLEAVQTIIHDYESYAQGALTCFQQKFHLDPYLPPLLEKFDRLRGISSSAPFPPSPP